MSAGHAGPPHVRRQYTEDGAAEDVDVKSYDFESHHHMRPALYRCPKMFAMKLKETVSLITGTVHPNGLGEHSAQDRSSAISRSASASHQLFSIGIRK